MVDFGPATKILPDQYKNLYVEWVDVSPKLMSMAQDNIFFEGMAVMYFFIEFSIPWIMKWNVKVNNTSEGFPCLQQTFYTKFWSKLINKDLDGKVHGQEILDLINEKINNYHVQEISEPQEDSLIPFKQISRKLHMKKGIVYRLEAIALYMEEVKKDLMKNLDIDIKDDISMASASHTNDEDNATCLVGEGQDIDEEVDLDALFNRFQQQVEESSSTSTTINKNDRVVNFNAFSKLFVNDTALITAQHVIVMIKQNNYANIYMSILGDHIISLHDKVDKIISLLPTKNKGKEKIAHSSLQPLPEIEDFKIKNYLNLENFLEKKFKGGGIQPINAENFSEGELSHNNKFSDDINKISERYARKPVQRMHYYPRPTPQDILLEEHEHIITNSYNGKKIYEWNIDEKLESEGSSSGSSTSEDLKALQQEDYMTLEDECSPCQQGMTCEKDDDEDGLYKIYSQFKELSINVIDNDNVLELLQSIKVSEIRAQIIDNISNTSTSKDKDHTPEESPTKEGSYSMTEVKNLLLKKMNLISSPTTISDLKK
ncbi:hypothetical protein H5410_041623 [Solanum commersonii]|uniref:Uncharacterized protein n=1 Tax=Solanum commersonii TaxID=4109 RepID=A0A9J5XTE9_SOLCO|nr:hypothetical protein H5410_041623 [Solanum commersonii]